MSRIIASSTAALLMGTLFLGCMSTETSIRGQNPSGGLFGGHQNQMSYGGTSTTYAGPGGQTTFRQHKSHCPFCQGQGQPGGCPECQCETGGSGWYPTHVNRFSYQAPQNLVYPQQNAPAAVVQYPYYTVRGPTDYFMK